MVPFITVGEVLDRITTTFFNGREVHNESLDPAPEPWVAIRSSYRHDGGVDDLRITQGDCAKLGGLA